LKIFRKCIKYFLLNTLKYNKQDSFKKIFKYKSKLCKNNNNNIKRNGDSLTALSALQVKIWFMLFIS